MHFLNRSGKTRKLSVTACIEAALGRDRKESVKFLSCGRGEGFIYVKRDNKYAYLYLAGEFESCLDRDAFFGEGDITQPLGMRLKNLPEGKEGINPFLAGRFAAKEAAVKALGSGFSGGIGLQHIEILPSAAGKPLLHFHGPAAALAIRLEVEQQHVTITHDRHVAAAVVILESA